MRTILSVSLTALLCAVAACGSSSTSPGCSPSATQICMAGSAFNKLTDTVSVGATVVWKNADGFTHTVTSSSVPSGGPLWDKTVTGGSSTSVTFPVAGTYQYYCRIHGSPGAGMHGTLVVQ
jgi:plastocyanin